MTGYTFEVCLYNFLQYLNSISSSLVLGVVSLVTIVGLVNQKGALPGFQNSVLAVATTHLIMATMWILAFPIKTYPYATIYLSAQIYPEWLVVIINNISSFSLRMNTELIAVTIVYRTILILRPKWANLIGFVLFLNSFIVPSIQWIFFTNTSLEYRMVCDFICSDDNSTGPKVMRLQDVTYEKGYSNTGMFIDLAMMILLIVVGIPCIIVLYKWFQKGNFSRRTLMLQKRLTWSMTAMMIAHFSIFLSTIVYLIGAAIFRLTGVDTRPTGVMVATLIASWVYPVEALVVYASVKEVLKCPKKLKNFVWKMNAKTVKNVTVFRPISTI